MFEKDAEEYANGKGHEHYNYLFEENAGSPATFANWCFKDGAEFGYNKANEWHYVKDGDLPKAYQKCYFIHSNTYGESNKVIFSEGNINVLTGVYAFYYDQETGEETTDPCFYDDINDEEIGLSEVYAWKEIVLPEFPKESENYTVEQNTGENQIEGGVVSISSSVPKYRPFKDCDELVETYHKRAFTPILAEELNKNLKKMYRPEIWVKSKEYGTDNLITAFDNDNESIGGSCVFIQDMWVDMKELFDNFTFLDGSPCGAEE